MADPCTAWRLVVDASVVLTGVAAIIAAVYSAKQARSTAAVNAATLAGLQEERVRRQEERDYEVWLVGVFADYHKNKNIWVKPATEQENRFCARAVAAGLLTASGGSAFILTGNARTD